MPDQKKINVIRLVVFFAERNEDSLWEQEQENMIN